MEYGTSNKWEKQNCVVFRCLHWWILFILAWNIEYHNGKLLEILDLKNIVCLFIEATLDFDYPLKKSGRVCLNLEFFDKIIDFLKKMNDWDLKMQMFGVKIPPKIVKKDLFSNYSKKVEK